MRVLVCQQLGEIRFIVVLVAVIIGAVGLRSPGKREMLCKRCECVSAQVNGGMRVSWVVGRANQNRLFKPDCCVPAVLVAVFASFNFLPSKAP